MNPSSGAEVRRFARGGEAALRAAGVKRASPAGNVRRAWRDADCGFAARVQKASTQMRQRRTFPARGVQTHRASPPARSADTPAARKGRLIPALSAAKRLTPKRAVN